MLQLANPLLKPWAAEQMKKTREEIVAGGVPFDPAAHCWPPGVPAIATFGVAPFYFLQNEGEVTIVYERGQVGENLRQWGHVRLFSPFAMNSTPLGRATLRGARKDLPADSDLLTGREHLAAYLQPLVETPPLAGHIETGVHVLAIGRHGFFKEDGPGDARRGQQPFRLLVRDASGRRLAKREDDLSLCELRAGGTDARAVVEWVARSAGMQAERPRAEELVCEFEMSRLPRESVLVTEHDLELLRGAR